MNLRRARLLQLLGFLVALLGLTGYWLTHDRVERTPLTEEVREVYGIPEDAADDEVITFVIAGRDIQYTQFAGPPIYRDGRIVGRQYESKHDVYGYNTDTIIFASLLGDKLTLVNIPRDIWLFDWETKINAMYAYQGAEGVQNSVSNLLGVPVDYYAIINIDIFKQFVDALGGVEVNVQERMFYQDFAADLLIDLEPGVQMLDGEDAAGFVRYRSTRAGDIDRIDRVKTLAYAMLARLKDLNVRAAGRLPQLTRTVFENTETNADYALITSLMSRVNTIEIANSVTLPATQFRAELPSGERPAALRYDPEEIEDVLAKAFGGTPREFANAPEKRLLITNKSGEAGLARAIEARLVALGVPEEVLITREGELDVTPTRIYATLASFDDADYYSSLLNVSKQQANTLATYEGEEVGFELVLGRDAAESYLGQTFASTSASINNVSTER